MAAYAALTSLKTTILDLQNHPSPPISIDEQQVRSLTDVVNFLQEFLKGYYSNSAYNDEADPLEIRIVDAAYKAEDVIESKIVERIRSQSTILGEMTGEDLYQDLQLVIEEMDMIKKVATTIHTDSTAVQPQPRRYVSIAVGSSSSTTSSTGKNNTMVGFDDVFLQVLESLTGSQLDLQIIPITGMGGIGKTTLARNLFENALIKEHFDIRAWTTISQDYNAQQALKELLSQARGHSSDLSESELGLELYQYLSHRRYLIVLDDMWSIEVWDKIRRYFPNCNDRSRVIVTSRLSSLVSHMNNGLNMKFLDEVSSLSLFSKVVFGEESFPLDLEDIGEKIVRKCRGLPLSIVTVGGFLSKSEQTREYWEQIEENMNSIVNLEDDEYCLRILKMSYNRLPVHLKPCFLYMGVYEEDYEIEVSKLIKLWVSEGFLEPTSEKSLETIAEENLKDLVDRNLILVHELGSTRNMKLCKIHDLLRDLCMREAEKERFYHVIQNYIPQGINNMRRIVMHGNTLDELVVEALQSIPHARSIIRDRYSTYLKSPILLNFRLLRTMEAYGLGPSEKLVFELVNLRYLSIEGVDEFQISSSVNLLWNLHTLTITQFVKHFTIPEIWKMPRLRHVKISSVCLPNPPTGHVVIMENLHTLKTILNFKLSEDVVKRIPNVKKLELVYDENEPSDDYYCLNYLECLHRLESFQCRSKYLYNHDFLKKLTFPKSLKKLSFHFDDEFELEEMLEKIGSLPLLQMFKLIGGTFRTREWVTVEGQFPRLEVFKLLLCRGLEHWTLQSSHFPLLKEIYLDGLKELKDIPSEIGDISTLRFIKLFDVNKSAVMSLKEIVDEQEELQGEELSFHVRVHQRREEAMEGLAGPNFEVIKLS